MQLNNLCRSVSSLWCRNVTCYIFNSELILLFESSTAAPPAQPAAALDLLECLWAEQGGQAGCLQGELQPKNLRKSWTQTGLLVTIFTLYLKKVHRKLLKSGNKGCGVFVKARVTYIVDFKVALRLKQSGNWLPQISQLFSTIKSFNNLKWPQIFK